MDLSLNCHTLFIQISSSQRCYPIYLHAPLVIVFIKTVLCSLLFRIFKQHFLSVNCFTVKEAGFTVIRSKKVLPLQRLSSNFLSIFLCAYILALIVTNSVLVFHQVHLSSFLKPFYSFLSSFFNYPLVSLAKSLQKSFFSISYIKHVHIA